MTDPNTGSDLVTVNTPRGEKHLPRLTPSDMLRLKNRIRKERKDDLRANIKETGITGETACRMLNEFDSRPVDRFDVVTYGLLPEGVAEVVPMAWLHTYGPLPATEDEYAQALNRAKAEVEAWGMSPKEMALAAAGVLYVELRPVEKTEGQASPPLPESVPDSPTSTTSATRAA